MRLLIVSQYFWPEDFRVNDLVSALRERGHVITVLTGYPNYPDGDIFSEFRERPREYGTYHGAEVQRVPLLPRRRGTVRLALNYASFAVTASTIGAWRLRRRAFDAVFVYQPSPITSCIPAIVIGRLVRAPVLLWTLDLWPDTLQAIGVVRSPTVLRGIGRMVAFIYRHCALVLGQSKGFAANVVQYGGDPARFRYFPQWSEPLFDTADGPVVVAPEALGFRDTFNVMFAGNIGEAQDFPAILDAAERLRSRTDIRWLIVGDGRTAEWVRGEIVRRNLSERVFLLGRHPLARMPEFFRAAGALLVTLRKDPVFALTIPGKVQTYLASGLPVIGMLDGEGAQVIRDAGAGLTCAAGDGQALAEQVEALASHTAEARAAMGANGLAYSQREFDRGQLLARLEGWIADLQPRFDGAAS